MLKNSWKSISKWSVVSTIIFFILGWMVNPNLDTSVTGIIKALAALFIASFFVLTLVVGVLSLITEYKTADKQGKYILIILVVLALIYTVPKIIADLK